MKLYFLLDSEYRIWVKLGKRDRLDAHAVARLVRDEAITLPRVVAEDTTAVLDVLVTEREAALAEATRLRNHVHQ